MVKVIRKSSTLALGVIFGSTTLGLIIGEVIIRVVNVISQLGTNLGFFLRSLTAAIAEGKFRSIALEYKNFPLYLFPASLTLQLTIHLPIFFIGKLYDPQTLGYYSLAISLLGIPVLVVGFSAGKVFLQRVNELYESANMQEIQNLLESFLIGLTIVGTVGYGIIFGFGPAVFRLIAGIQWEISGDYARILSFPLVFQLINVAIGTLFVALRKEKIQFQSNMISAILMAIVLVSGIFLELEPLHFVILVGSSILLKNIVVFIYTIKISPLNTAKTFLIVTISIASGFAMLYLLGQLFDDFL